MSSTNISQNQPIGQAYKAEIDNVKKNVGLWVASSLLPDFVLNLIHKITGGEKLTDYYANRVFNQAEGLIAKILADKTKDEKIDHNMDIVSNEIMSAGKNFAASYLHHQGWTAIDALLKQFLGAQNGVIRYLATAVIERFKPEIERILNVHITTSEHPLSNTIKALPETFELARKLAVPEVLWSIAKTVGIPLTDPQDVAKLLKGYLSSEGHQTLDNIVEKYKPLAVPFIEKAIKESPFYDTIDGKILLPGLNNAQQGIQDLMENIWKHVKTEIIKDLYGGEEAYQRARDENSGSFIYSTADFALGEAAGVKSNALSVSNAVKKTAKRKVDAITTDIKETAKKVQAEVKEIVTKVDRTLDQVAAEIKETAEEVKISVTRGVNKIEAFIKLSSKEKTTLKRQFYAQLGLTYDPKASASAKPFDSKTRERIHDTLFQISLTENPEKMAEMIDELQFSKKIKPETVTYLKDQLRQFAQTLMAAHKTSSPTSETLKAVAIDTTTKSSIQDNPVEKILEPMYKPANVSTKTRFLDTFNFTLNKDKRKTKKAFYEMIGRSYDSKNPLFGKATKELHKSLYKIARMRREGKSNDDILKAINQLKINPELKIQVQKFAFTL